MDLVPSPMCTFVAGDHEEAVEQLLISRAYTGTFWLSAIS